MYTLTCDICKEVIQAGVSTKAPDLHSICTIHWNDVATKTHVKYALCNKHANDLRMFLTKMENDDVRAD